MTKKALVTGASEGIGRAFAKKLVSEGYQVTAVARNESRLKELVAELSMSSAGHSLIVQDLSKPAGWEAIASELEKNHYNLLINNAGYSVYGKFSETPLESLQQMTRVNCDALVALSYSFLQNARPGDALINIGSTLSFMPMPTNGLYAATKAFVLSFTESLWHEQKAKGVYVLAVCPGITATQFHSRAGTRPDGTPNGYNEKLPAALTQTPEQVVHTAMRKLKMRSSPTVISGIMNYLTVLFFRMLPRKVMIKIMGSLR